MTSQNQFHAFSNPTWSSPDVDDDSDECSVVHLHVLLLDVQQLLSAALRPRLLSAMPHDACASGAHGPLAPAGALLQTRIPIEYVKLALSVSEFTLYERSLGEKHWQTLDLDSDREYVMVAKENGCT